MVSLLALDPRAVPVALRALADEHDRIMARYVAAGRLPRLQ